jgi:TRAP-type transport system periplasmic protein
MKKILSGCVYVVIAIAVVMAGFESAPPSPTRSALLTAFLSTATASAQTPAKQIRLKFASHGPSIHHSYKGLFEPWAAEVEKRTEGRVKIAIYPDQQLGKLPEMYDDLLRGTSDIALILPGFIMGRFPLEGVFALPTLVPGDDADPTCRAIRTMVYEKYLIPLYFKDVKVLWTGRYGPTNFLMAGKPVRKLEDLKGKIIGFGGGRTPPLILKALGAASESIQSADVYTSLDKKVIDGMLFPLSTLRAFKLTEVAKYVTRVDFGSASNFTAMRLSAWNSLSPADQKVITDLIPWALEAQGKTYRNDDELAIETGKKAGVEFIELSSTEKQRWIDALKPVDKQWMTEMDALGLPATKMYNDILQITHKK